jgi:signal transduction histidine kinase
MTLSDEELLFELERKLMEYRNLLVEQKQLTGELVSTNRKLVESETLKSHFISNITNEIINPFSSILGLSRSILMVKDKDWNKVINMARMIHSEAFGLDFQLRNIFAAARIEAGDLFIEASEVNLSDLINNICETFRNEADRKNIQIETNLNHSVMIFISDEEKLRLIIANLLSNAIKYSLHNERIILVSEFSGKDLVITLKDNGIGICKSDRDEIFDRFKRIDDQISSLNIGQGLGLSIVKSLVELLGGSIQVKSEVNIGTEFIVSVPQSERNTSVYDISGGTDLLTGSNNEVF